MSRWFFGEFFFFFFVVNAKKLKVLTDKILLDRFFLKILIAITIASAQRIARQVCLGALAKSPTCLPAATSDELIACL